MEKPEPPWGSIVVLGAILTILLIWKISSLLVP